MGLVYDYPFIHFRPYASEHKHLHLTLAKITRFDYVVANQRFGDPEMATFLGNSPNL